LGEGDNGAIDRGRGHCCVGRRVKLMVVFRHLLGFLYV
jgi:hypothetical protein